MTPRARKILLLTLLFAFAIRVVYVLEARDNPFHVNPQMDALYHLDWAKALLAGGDHHPGPFFRAPLYPWFLAGALWVAQGSTLIVLVIQALLGVLTTYLTFLVSQKAFPRSGDRGPLIAAILVASNWVLVYFDGELLLPTLAIPLQLTALLFTLSLRESPTPRRTFLVGLIWGLAAIVRPNCLLFVMFLALWVALRSPRKPLQAIALAIGALMPILPLTAYNVSQGDRVLISSQAGINLWIGNNPDSDGSTAVVPGTRHGWWSGHHDANRQAEMAEGRELSGSEVSSHYTRRAFSWAAADPAAFLSNLLFKARLLISHRELGNNAEISFLSTRFSEAMRALPPSFALLFGLGVFGLLLGWRRKELLPELPAYLVVYAVSVLAFFVCARFRAPMLPLLACGAGHSISWMHGAFMAGNHRGPLKLTIGVAALITASVFAIPRGTSTQAKGLWQLGIAALQNQDDSTAIERFEESLRHDPEFWYSLRDLGRTKLHAGELNDAEAALKRGLNIRPNESQLGDLLAEVYFEGGRPRAQELENFARRVLEVNPGHATAWFHLAQAALLTGRNQIAMRHVQSGLSLNPTNFHCLFLDARLRSLAGDKAGACASIERALEAATLNHDQEQETLATVERQRIGCP